MMLNGMIKHNINNYSLITTVLVIFTMLTKNLQSQGIAHGIMMSSVGIIGSLSNNSMSIDFSSKNGCINIQNGVAVLIGDRSKGEFVISCKMPVKLNTLGAVLYPNPVTNKTTVRFNNKPMFDEGFVLTVWSIEGASLFSEKVNGSELVAGKVLDLGKLVSGTYLITVESSQYTDTIKFIKV